MTAPAQASTSPFPGTMRKNPRPESDPVIAIVDDAPSVREGSQYFAQVQE